MDSFEEEERRKLKNAKQKMENARIKALKFKILMERALQDREDAE